jgi:hypothetical protein
LRTNETVVRETPAAFATSALVGRLGMGRSAPPLDGASRTWCSNARQ